MLELTAMTSFSPALNSTAIGVPSGPVRPAPILAAGISRGKSTDAIAPPRPPSVPRGRPPSPPPYCLTLIWCLWLAPPAPHLSSAAGIAARPAAGATVFVNQLRPAVRADADKLQLPVLSWVEGGTPFPIPNGVALGGVELHRPACRRGGGGDLFGGEHQPLLARGHRRIREHIGPREFLVWTKLVAVERPA